MERQSILTWDDIIAWLINHPYISFAGAVFLLVGAVGSLVEKFPSLGPVARVLGYGLAIIVGGFAFFFWLVPDVYNAVSSHSRLENTANIIVILLVLILAALWRAIEILKAISRALTHGR